MKYMLDTNICIYAIKRKDAQLLNKLLSVDPNDVCVSSITYAELLYGVEKSEKKEQNRIALYTLFAEIKIEDFDARAAEEYGKVRATLEKQGTPIGGMDMLIAGHAISMNCVLVTNNTKEFQRVKELTIENWVSN